MTVLNDASQVMAAQPANDPSAVTAPPAPNAPPVSGGIVTQAAPAANAVQQGPSAAPPNTSGVGPANPPANNPQSDQDAHHSLLGRAVKSMVHAIEGNDVSYQPDENGQVREVVTPAKPGTLFRRLLAGALIGGAAGASRRNFTQGFGQGAEASAAQSQQQDQQRYDRARQQIADQQRQQQVSDEHQLHQASVAHSNVQMSSLLHDMWASDQDRIERLNASSRVYRQAMLDKGGIPAKFRVNGQMVDSLPADQFAKLYVSDPSILHSTDQNSERHFISNTDLSEVHFDGQSWRDDAGEEIGMGPRTTISAIDMPTNSMNSYESVDGATLDKIAGGPIVPDPDKKYSINGHGLLALRTLGLKQQAEDTREAAVKVKAERANQANKQFTAIASRKTTRLQKAEHDYSKGDIGLDELNRQKQLIQNSYEEEVKSAGGTPTHYEYGSPASQTQTNQPRNAPRTFNLSKWKAANPTGDTNEAIAEAKRQNLQIIQ